MSKAQRTMEVGETVSFIFDFHKELEKPWRANYQYSLTDYVTIGAYVYECTNAGKTGKQLPENLTTTIGATQDDGTVEWTCRDWSTNGTDTISTRTVTAGGSGITVDSSSISNSLYVETSITAVTVGAWDLECSVTTASGETLKHSIDIVVTN